MSSRAQASDSQDRGRTGRRRREILGIFLLASGLFSGLALASMHAGDNRMVGPAGAGAAGALYALLGAGAYLLVAGLVLAAVRCFRGRPLVDSVVEGAGAAMLLASTTVLLHLPFSGRPHALRGPGGLMGQWLGEIAASFIGTIGAGLGAAAMLFVAILLVTEIQLREVGVVLAWAARHTKHGVMAGLRSVGRLVLAMFPEREERSAAERDDASAASGDDEAPAGDPRHADAHADDDGDARAPALHRLAAADATAALRARADNADRDDADDAVRVGRGRSLDDPYAGEWDEQRAAIAAVVAEVAAVERVPAPAVAADDDAAGDAAEDRPAIAAVASGAVDAGPHVIEELPATSAAGEPEAASPPGPIIVEPAWKTRLREREQQAQQRDDEPAAAAAASDGPSFIRLKDGAYQLPATDLLEYIPPQGNDLDKQGLYDMAERLEQAMANYGVRGKVKEIHMGPVVTMYEFAPAPGTRTGKIANLEKDLAMALEAQAVRIVAPIPGKAVVGVEVPNKTREMVYLREILDDDCFTKASSKLQMALGKDIKGAPVSVNLGKMPHLLVAGTTGSGKSVAVNGMIVSLLYNATPEDVRFIMVDPKMLELSIYEGIPHLLLPVVTDPKKANLALRWAVEEMERRYELLSKAGVRDIAGYNAKVEGKPAEGAAAGAGASAVSAAAAAASARKKRLKVVIAGADGTEQEVDVTPEPEVLAPTDGVVAEPMDEEEVSGIAAAAQATREADAAATAAAGPPPKKLPYIVIVIDEFADLMMVAPKDVETSVARIAQKARAAGLHLILATQRPSVDVITGLIKANFPSRIALQVASRIDSRTILDQPGADTLLGNGDMLFSDRGLKLRRVHGAFLSDGEVHRVVDHLKAQAKPVYDMDILKPREEDAEEGGAPADDFHDELYDQAMAIVCETRQASVSYIQRRLQIGYNRAARLVEHMERDGVVGPANGAKPREVLAPPGEYLQQAG